MFLNCFSNLFFDFLNTLDFTNFMGTPVAASGVSIAPEVNGAILQFDDPLAEGSYRATVSDLVTDLAGNPLAAPFEWTFEVRDATFWISGFGSRTK